ncbi:hypothetical protein D3C78_1852300 [compost metagenome]
MVAAIMAVVRGAAIFHGHFHRLVLYLHIRHVVARGRLHCLDGDRDRDRQLIHAAAAHGRRKALQGQRDG